MVSAYAPPMEGGSERFCFNLSKSLLKRGYEVEIYTSLLPPNLPWHEIREGIPIVRFRCFKYMLQINPLVFFMKAVERNLKLFDLIHVHSYIYFLANQIALLRRMKRFPFILHLHGGLDYLYPQLVSYKATAMKIFYDATVGPFTMKMADKLVACCETDKRNAIKNFGIKHSKIVTIPNSIEIGHFSPTTNRNPVNIIFIGRISELKGSHQLPYIIKTVHQKYGEGVKFTFVGGGPRQRQFKQLCNEKKFPTTFVGKVPNSEIPKLLEESNILILPSFVEGFPLVVLESLASAVPVVAYDVGGVWEVVKNDETGFLVPVGDYKEFAESLSWLIDNESERRKMGLCGRKIVMENYSWSKSVSKIEEVYEDVLRNF